MPSDRKRDDLCGVRLGMPMFCAVPAGAVASGAGRSRAGLDPGPHAGGGEGGLRGGPPEARAGSGEQNQGRGVGFRLGLEYPGTAPIFRGFCTARRCKLKLLASMRRAM
jgi:hypothetical protein